MKKTIALLCVLFSISAFATPGKQGTDLIGKDFPKNDKQVEKLLHKMNTVFGEDDGIHWFNVLYTRTTRAIRDAATEGKFENQVFMRKFVMIFANYYFRAVSLHLNGEQLESRAWRPVFDRRDIQDFTPLQFAIAGLIAHISHDLPLALEEASQNLGIVLNKNTPEHRDYLKINEILKDAWIQIRGNYKAICQSKRWENGSPLCSMSDETTNKMMAKLRDKAFKDAQKLGELRGDAEGTMAYRAYLDRLTYAAGSSIFYVPATETRFELKLQ